MDNSLDVFDVKCSKKNICHAVLCENFEVSCYVNQVRQRSLFLTVFDYAIRSSIVRRAVTKMLPNVPCEFHHFYANQ